VGTNRYKKNLGKGTDAVVFKEFFSFMKPILKGRNVSEQMRELVSMITIFDADIDPSQTHKPSILKAYANGSRDLSEDYAREIISVMDYRNFIESVKSNDDAVITKLAEAFSSIDASITESNIGTRAADIFVDILYDAAGEGRKNGQKKSSNAPSRMYHLKYKYGERLLIESRGTCPNKACGKPLSIKNHNQTEADYLITVIDGNNQADDYSNLIALCPECSRTYSLNPSEDDIARMYEIKWMLTDRENGDLPLVFLNIEEGIEEVLECLCDVDYRSLVKLNYEPKEVQDKIYSRDYLLLKKNIENVTSYYPFVKDKFITLEKEQRLNYEMLAMQVRQAYLTTIKNTNSQTETYDRLVDWLINKTRKRRDSCEVVISFFVQTCEVFDAASK